MSSSIIMWHRAIAAVGAVEDFVWDEHHQRPRYVRWRVVDDPDPIREALLLIVAKGSQYTPIPYLVIRAWIPEIRVAVDVNGAVWVPGPAWTSMVATYAANPAVLSSAEHVRECAAAQRGLSQLVHVKTSAWTQWTAARLAARVEMPSVTTWGER